MQLLQLDGGSDGATNAERADQTRWWPGWMHQTSWTRSNTNDKHDRQIANSTPRTHTHVHTRMQIFTFMHRAVYVCVCNKTMVVCMCVCVRFVENSKTFFGCSASIAHCTCQVVRCCCCCAAVYLWRPLCAPAAAHTHTHRRSLFCYSHLGCWTLLWRKVSAMRAPLERLKCKYMTLANGGEGPRWGFAV